MPRETMYSWSEIRSGADRVMAAVTCMLFALGLTSIYSAGIGVRSATMNFVIKQSVWGGVSAVIYLFILRVGYRNFVRMSYWFYGATLALLMALDALGTVSKGAVRWFQIGGIGFQPAELGKVTLILFLARFCSRHQPDTLKNLASSLALSGASVLMVLLQPDLGTSLVYIAIILSVLVVAGAPAKYLGGMLAAAVAALPLFLKVLKPYQLRRLVVFLDPYTDPQGAGYNVIQSRIAVGSGGLWGKGFLQGTQGRLKFLPEPHTDFIFSVFAEEFGFVGGVAVIILFSILFWRILRGAFRTKDTRAKLLCIGIVAWLWFQVMESVAMSMGLAPITGLPLPLFSYGGSSLLMVSIGLALAQSVAVSPVRDRFARIS